jgi:hypothetical protein
MGKWYGMNWIRPTLRGAIMSRDGWACVFCGTAKNLGLDHLKPRIKGGTNKPTNLVTCCVSCNASKGDRAWKQFAADGNVIAFINRTRRKECGPNSRRRKNIRKVLKEMTWKELLTLKTHAA